MTFYFVRTETFDNSRAVRELPWQGWHAWCIRSEHLETFLETYPECQVCEPPEGGIAYAINYAQADAYICGRSGMIPDRVPFDPEVHSIQVREDIRCDAGCPNCGYEYLHVDYYNPWQILIVPKL